jgi:cell division protein FtsW (lipid II flippase)
MKRSIGLWQLMGFAITSLGGTLLHFLYEWLGKAAWIAPFSGVNESTWEHMKLLFWPMLIFAVVESFFFRDREDFWCVKLHGILIGLVLIPVIFYTYNGVIGKSPDWINIAIFFVSAAASYIYEAKAFRKDSKGCKNPKLAIAILAAVALMFVIFTFKTPEIGIFKDPLTGTYGI